MNKDNTSMQPQSESDLEDLGKRYQAHMEISKERMRGVHAELNKGPECLKQGTDLWMNLRRELLVTGSEAGALMGVGRYMTRKKLQEYKAGTWVPPVPSSFQQHIMDRGHRYEELARRVYVACVLPFAAHSTHFVSNRFSAPHCYQVGVTTKGLIRGQLKYGEGAKSTIVHIGYSPDGFGCIEAVTGPWERFLLEIKVPFKALYTEVHPDHYCQVQMGLLLGQMMKGVDYPMIGHYVSFLPLGLTPEGNDKHYQVQEDEYEEEEEKTGCVPICRVWSIKLSKPWQDQFRKQVKLLHDLITEPKDLHVNAYFNKNAVRELKDFIAQDIKRNVSLLMELTMEDIQEGLGLKRKNV